jgi:hypothetical protein
MADIKTLIVSVPEITEDQGPGCQEALKKGAYFRNYSTGPVLDSVDQDQALAARVQTVDSALERLGQGAALTYLELTTPDFDRGLYDLIDRSDRRTVIALISTKVLLFYGLNINVKVKPASPSSFQDVLPTLAQMGEFYLSDQVRGTILFEALKNPNYKQTQVAKLKAALDRLEKILKRDNREPWDKHDCA